MSYTLATALIFLAFALAELAAGRFFNADRTTRKDLILETGSGLVLPGLVVPFIMVTSAHLAEAVVPDSAGRWSHWHPAVMFAVLLVADDLTQYLWHRASHASPALYRLHRAHHSAEYMSVRITYRNNILYYAMMPGLWLSGLLVYWGFAPVYYVYLVAKMLVVVGAHSSVAWDEPLYRSRLGRPIMWVLERLISTPATHAAHHGKHEADGVTWYHGNYGNFLFLWDVLFGTAKITRRRPQVYGLENVQPATWFEEWLWPSQR